MVWNFHTKGRKIFSSYLILKLLENNLATGWDISKNFFSVIIALRSGRWQIFFKIGVPKIIVNFTENCLLEPLLNKIVALNVCNFIKKTLTQVFSCKTRKNFQNNFYTEHHQWLLLITPNHILHFNKKNKVSYIKLNKHQKTFIMSITLLKGLFWRLINMKIEQKVLYFPELYCICILNYQTG